MMARNIQILLSAFLTLRSVAALAVESPLRASTEGAEGATRSAYQPIVANAKPQEGVFVSRNFSFIFVLELKEGQYRRWSVGHAFGEKGSPSALGSYVFEGDTVILKTAGKRDFVLVFRMLDEELTLWEPSAVELYGRERRLDPWSNGIFRFTKKTPEEMGYKR